MSAKNKKRDTHLEITQYMINALETVTPADFQAPFAKIASQQPPFNPMTEKYYNGINTFILWFQQSQQHYRSSEWGTFKQWKERNAQVRKGEESTIIIFYKSVEKKNTQGDEPEFYPCVRGYNVFNADQVEGYEPEPEIKNNAVDFGTVENIEQLDAFITATGAVVIDDQNLAAFNPIKDLIKMPNKDFFYGDNQRATENYYAVLLHELTHWAGDRKRVEYDFEGKTKLELKAFEELTAELGAAFLCSQFGIKQHGREDHAMYIKSWLQALKNDKKFIFKAAAQAQKRVDYLNWLQTVN